MIGNKSMDVCAIRKQRQSARPANKQITNQEDRQTNRWTGYIVDRKTVMLLARTYTENTSA